MRATARATEAYLLVAMLTAAAAGRQLDATGLLPGVREAGAVRGGAGTWTTALGTAALVALAAAAQWGRTREVRATAVVVLPGQLLVFFCAEAAGRVASGAGPVDPDGLIGALLQAALAGLLLLALSLAAAVLLRCAPLVAGAPAPHLRPTQLGSPTGRSRGAGWVEPRGPPAALGC